MNELTRINYQNMGYVMPAGTADEKLPANINLPAVYSPSKLGYCTSFAKNTALNLAVKNPLKSVADAYYSYTGMDAWNRFGIDILSCTVLGSVGSAVSATLHASGIISTGVGIATFLGSFPAGYFLPRTLYVGAKSVYNMIKNIPFCIKHAFGSARFEQSADGEAKRQREKLAKIKLECEETRKRIENKRNFDAQYASAQQELLALRAELNNY